MKEQLSTYKSQFTETWQRLSTSNKMIASVSFAILLIGIILIVLWASRPEFVPIYTDVRPDEAGEIVQEIESRGIEVQLSDDGRTISVPRTHAQRLKVELAHSGIPRSGNIDYGIFSENMGLSMTDQQFEVVERDAMQGELRRLIETISGVQHANVMITLPEESIWVADDERQATASVVVTTTRDLDQTQINGLYHLVSRSVPSLPVENIEIMNHQGQPLAFADESVANNRLSEYQQQREIRRDIEQDIQRELQRFLGTIVGPENVIVSVFANVDFSRERVEENRVEAIDPESNEGLAISIERIQETYEGEGSPIGGIAGTGEQDIAGYPGAEGGEQSEYDRLEERINYEVDRIYRQIDSAPYIIDDLSIHVGVSPPEDPALMNEQDFVQELNDIEAVVQTIAMTSLSTVMDPENEEQFAERINVFANDFRGRPDVVEAGEEFPMSLVYIGLAVLGAILLVAGVLTYVAVRRRRKADEQREQELLEQQKQQEVEYGFDSADSPVKQQVEHLAKKDPDEFAKLLKTWLSED